MATAFLYCDECGKTLKTFQALLKHFAQRHANKQVPKRAVFKEGEQEIKPASPQEIRSTAVKAEYKAWLIGVTERINGIHHRRHKSKFKNKRTHLVGKELYVRLGSAKLLNTVPVICM